MLGISMDLNEKQSVSHFLFCAIGLSSLSMRVKYSGNCRLEKTHVSTLNMRILATCHEIIHQCQLVSFTFVYLYTD